MYAWAVGRAEVVAPRHIPIGKIDSIQEKDAARPFDVGDKKQLFLGRKFFCKLQEHYASHESAGQNGPCSFGQAMGFGGHGFLRNCRRRLAASSKCGIYRQRRVSKKTTSAVCAEQGRREWEAKSCLWIGTSKENKYVEGSLKRRFSGPRGASQFALQSRLHITARSQQGRPCSAQNSTGSLLAYPTLTINYHILTRRHLRRHLRRNHVHRIPWPVVRKEHWPILTGGFMRSVMFLELANKLSSTEEMVFFVADVRAGLAAVFSWMESIFRFGNGRRCRSDLRPAPHRPGSTWCRQRSCAWQRGLLDQGSARAPLSRLGVRRPAPLSRKKSRQSRAFSSAL